MEITEIRIKLMDDPNDRLQAFCSITFDGCFVIRDLKIIQGTKGSFVAMPSRKLTDRCPRCAAKNHLRARFCSECGTRLQEERAVKADDGRAKLYADIAHPINCDCRDMIQRRVLEAYSLEMERSKLPGYICMYDDYGEESFAALHETEDVLDLPQVALPEGPRRRDIAANLATNAPHHLRVGRENGRLVTARAEGSDEDNFGAGLI